MPPPIVQDKAFFDRLAASTTPLTAEDESPVDTGAKEARREETEHEA